MAKDKSAKKVKNAMPKSRKPPKRVPGVPGKKKKK